MYQNGRYGTYGTFRHEKSPRFTELRHLPYSTLMNVAENHPNDRIRLRKCSARQREGGAACGLRGSTGELTVGSQIYILRSGEQTMRARSRSSACRYAVNLAVRRGIVVSTAGLDWGVV